MRFRYSLEDGKHLVRTRADDGTWKETRSYPSPEEAQAVVAKGEAMQASTIADVESALTGPKGVVHHDVSKPAARPEVKSGPPRKPVTREPASKEDWSDLDPHDFTVIPGIGAVTAEKLRDNGITTLKQLARVSASRADELGIHEAWIAKAKEMTDG